MNRITRSLFAVTLAGAVSLTPISFIAEQPLITTVYAHGHHSGSHHGNCNTGGTGTNYYYCNGHAAHLHTNGTCPYATSTTSSSVSKSIVKKVQKKLNRLGYDCGTPDGILGAKTKKALKRFQKEHCLKASGTIKKQL